MKKLSIAVVIASLFLASCSATNFLHKVKNKVMGKSQPAQTAPAEMPAPVAPTTVTEPTTAPTTAAPSDTMMKADAQVNTTKKN